MVLIDAALHWRMALGWRVKLALVGSTMALVGSKMALVGGKTWRAIAATDRRTALYFRLKPDGTREIETIAL